MRVFQINAVPYGSTGRIMTQIAQLLEAQGHEAMCTTGFTWQKSTYPKHFITSGLVAKTWHTTMARLTGLNGCFSVMATRRLLRRLNAFAPDVIHLHNLHCWYVNLPMLFGYIKKHDIPVVWTFHDCWPITGHCPHFTLSGCQKWVNGCNNCSAYRGYPQCLFDDSKAMWHRKKKWFTGVKHLTIVPPSHWLEGLVKQSYLQDYPVRVIHNGIDLAVFRPTDSDFRLRYGCQDKFLILGVAFDWSRSKGLDVFIELSKRLPQQFQILLVGTNEELDKALPKSIISVHRTTSAQELAQIYTAANLFVNPTREDTFPTVNMEALACGTPVLTFCTGGSPEIPDESCGSVVPVDDLNALEREILRIAQDKPYSLDACLKRAAHFHKDDRYREYIGLYQHLTQADVSENEHQDVIKKHD
jgi:glycosyltransferase involved in cell wall biosynthesis